MIVDKGADFPQEIDAALRTYGDSMWFFRDQPGATTTRALNSYTSDHHRKCVFYAAYALSRSHRVLARLSFLFLPSQAFNTLRLEYRSPLMT